MTTFSAFWLGLSPHVRAGCYIAMTVFWMALAVFLPGALTVPLAVVMGFVHGISFKITLDEMRRS